MERHGGDELRGVADEPGRQALVVARLAGRRTTERGRPDAGAAGDHLGQVVGHLVGDVSREAATALDLGLVEDAAVGVGDLLHGVRLGLDALVREGAVRAGHRQR